MRTCSARSLARVAGRNDADDVQPFMERLALEVHQRRVAPSGGIVQSNVNGGWRLAMSFFPTMSGTRKKKQRQTRRVRSRDDPGYINPFDPPKPPPDPPTITVKDAITGATLVSAWNAQISKSRLDRDFGITAGQSKLSGEQGKAVSDGLAGAAAIYALAMKHPELAKYGGKDRRFVQLLAEATSTHSIQGVVQTETQRRVERYLAAKQLASVIHEMTATPEAPDMLKALVGPMVSAVAAAQERTKLVMAIEEQGRRAARAEKESHRPVKADADDWERGMLLPSPKTWAAAKKIADDGFYAAQESKIKADETARQLKLKDEELNYWKQQFRTLQEQYEQQVRDYQDRVAAGTAPGWMTPPNSYQMDAAKREFEKRGGDERRLADELRASNRTILNYAQMYPALVAAIKKYGPMGGGGGGALPPNYDPDYMPQPPVTPTKPPSNVPEFLVGLLGLSQPDESGGRVAALIAGGLLLYLVMKR